MIPRPPRYTRTDSLFPYTPLCLSCFGRDVQLRLVRWCGRVMRVRSRVRLRLGGCDAEPASGEDEDEDKKGCDRFHGSWLRGQCSWSWPSSAGGFCGARSEEHTSELQSLMRISYAVFCLKKKK